MHIRELRPEDIPALKRFTDHAIGANYYSEAELEGYIQKSQKDGHFCSLILVDQKGEVRGMRLTCAPGAWVGGKGKGLSPQLWRVALQDAAYFQSLFIDPALTGKGWGKKLSLRALEILRVMGAKAVICHSWKESPHDSSGRYLRGLGFTLVATHLFYWKDVDYQCPRCGKPCECTAEEMIKYL